jgi:DNA-binding response OmpR family regulator
MKPFTDKVDIMLIDDDPEDSMFFKEALAEVNANHDYRWIGSAVEALSFLNEPDTAIPDILFLDLNMPMMSGKACLKEIRAMEKYATMPIAIYSTSSADQDKLDTFAGGANIFVTKPSDYETLKVVLKKVLNIQWQYHSLNFNIGTFVVSL